MHVIMILWAGPVLTRPVSNAVLCHLSPLCALISQAFSQYVGYDEAHSHAGSYANALYSASNRLPPLLQNCLLLIL